MGTEENRTRRKPRPSEFSAYLTENQYKRSKNCRYSQSGSQAPQQAVPEAVDDHVGAYSRFQFDSDGHRQTGLVQGRRCVLQAGIEPRGGGGGGAGSGGIRVQLWRNHGNWVIELSRPLD